MTDFSLCIWQDCLEPVDNRYFCSSHKNIKVEHDKPCTICSTILRRTYPVEKMFLCWMCLSAAKHRWRYEVLLPKLELLADYQSLGDYEELADLISRRDILLDADRLGLE